MSQDRYGPHQNNRSTHRHHPEQKRCRRYLDAAHDGEGGQACGEERLGHILDVEARQRAPRQGTPRLEQDEVVDILTRLGMEVKSFKDHWMVKPPSFRFDIEIEADVPTEVVGAVKPGLEIRVTLDDGSDHTARVRALIPISAAVPHRSGLPSGIIFNSVSRTCASNS